MAENKKAAQVLLPNNGGLFQQFEWIEDPYEGKQKAKTDDRLKSQMKADLHDTPFRPI